MDHDQPFDPALDLPEHDPIDSGPVDLEPIDGPDLAEPVDPVVPDPDLDPGETAVGGVRGPGIDDPPPVDPRPADPPSYDDQRPGPIDLDGEPGRGPGQGSSGGGPIVLDDPPGSSPATGTVAAGDAPLLDLDPDLDGTLGDHDTAIRLDDPGDGDLRAGDLDDDRLGPRDGGDDDDDGQDDLLEIDLANAPAPLGTPFDLADGNGLLQPALVAAAIAALGASAGHVLGQWRSPGSPPELAAALDQLGLDARVEHADLRELRDRIAEGHRVLLSTDGTAGVDLDAVVEVARLDERAGLVEVTDRSGRRLTYPLAELTAAWDESANQLVVAAGGDGTVVLLPVVLGPPQAPARQGRA